MKYSKNTESKNPKVAKTENGRIMLLSKCVLSHSKKLEFTREQEASGLLSSLGIKTPLNKIPLLGSLFFFKSIAQVNTTYKMNEIVSTFLLAGDKYMLEFHLR